MHKHLSASQSHENPVPLSKVRSTSPHMWHTPLPPDRCSHIHMRAEKEREKQYPWHQTLCDVSDHAIDNTCISVQEFFQFEPPLTSPDPLETTALVRRAKRHKTDIDNVRIDDDNKLVYYFPSDVLEKGGAENPWILKLDTLICNTSYLIIWADKKVFSVREGDCLDGIPIKHSSFTRGGPCHFAGELIKLGENKYQISDKTGHYHRSYALGPTDHDDHRERNFRAFIDLIIRKKQADVIQINHKKYRPRFSGSSVSDLQEQAETYIRSHPADTSHPKKAIPVSNKTIRCLEGGQMETCLKLETTQTTYCTFHLHAEDGAQPQTYEVRTDREAERAHKILAKTPPKNTGAS